MDPTHAICCRTLQPWPLLELESHSYQNATDSFVDDTNISSIDEEEEAFGGGGDASFDKPIFVGNVLTRLGITDTTSSAAAGDCETTQSNGDEVRETYIRYTEYKRD